MLINEIITKLLYELNRAHGTSAKSKKWRFSLHLGAFSRFHDSYSIIFLKLVLSSFNKGVIKDMGG